MSAFAIIITQIAYLHSKTLVNGDRSIRADRHFGLKSYGIDKMFN